MLQSMQAIKTQINKNRKEKKYAITTGILANTLWLEWQTAGIIKTGEKYHGKIIWQYSMCKNKWNPTYHHQWNRMFMWTTVHIWQTNKPSRYDV